jgi:hypothetical protein
VAGLLADDELIFASCAKRQRQEESMAGTNGRRTIIRIIGHEPRAGRTNPDQPKPLTYRQGLYRCAVIRDGLRVVFQSYDLVGLRVSEGERGGTGTEGQAARMPKPWERLRELNGASPGSCGLCPRATVLREPRSLLSCPQRSHPRPRPPSRPAGSRRAQIATNPSLPTLTCIPDASPVLGGPA